jgi:hypothetical protein
VLYYQQAYARVQSLSPVVTREDFIELRVHRRTPEPPLVWSSIRFMAENSWEEPIDNKPKGVVRDAIHNCVFRKDKGVLLHLLMLWFLAG